MRGGRRRIYIGFTAAWDENLGRILRPPSRTPNATGTPEDSNSPGKRLILFGDVDVVTSDNGARTASNEPLRGTKGPC